ncbi:VWA domain-containing protein [Candidatus Woesearchaeota archaeon]|nr:VWA domain-containing protein [Candidatus Woesearchaeota archaeon]
MGMKGGIFFSIDALIASIILISALLILSTLYIEESNTRHLSSISNDALGVFSEMRIGEINNSYVDYLFSQGEIKDANLTLIEQLGELWALNKTTLATNLAKNLTEYLFPRNFGFGIVIGNEVLYERNFSTKHNIIASRKMISGYEKTKPLKGSTSRSYLKGIKEKTFSSYAYLGGFIGQGNLSVLVSDVPAGVALDSMYMELDAGSNFNLFINNIQCNGTYSPSGGTMTADGWNISMCMPSFNTGAVNTFKIFFPGVITSSFVGGGFIRVSYTTDEFVPPAPEKEKTEWLPGISGIINLYSSIFVPGTLDSMQVYLHFLANTLNNSNTVYLMIGNTTVYRSTDFSGDQIVSMQDINLTKFLNYTELNMRTIPIRIGFENVSFQTFFEGNGDVMIITDVSGSMDWRMDVDNVNGVRRNCNDTDLDNLSTARLSIAKCLDKEFARDIINSTGNRVGLVSYDSSTHNGETVLPTSDLNQIDTIIGNASPETGYEASGGTCICCGINSAKDVLVAEIGNISLISPNSLWRYNNFSLSSTPPNDPLNNSWYDADYTLESGWYVGASVLGATNGFAYAFPVITEMGSSLTGSRVYANLWENSGDSVGAPNDFSSGTLNTTGNTYGIGGNDDGWDTDSPRNGTGPFGYDDDVDYNNLVTYGGSQGYVLEFDNNYQGNGNQCTNFDCSAAYGIMVNITPALFNILQSNGEAHISFYYQWDDRNNNVFRSTNDQVWIKSRWTSPVSGGHDLGTNLDAGHSGADASVEIETRDNPDNDFSGFYSQNITAWIESPGLYYFEIGGKLQATPYWFYDFEKWGWWRFDDIQIEISNVTDYYYLRKDFNITNISQVKKGVLNVLSDDAAAVYINGVEVDVDYGSHMGDQWNRRGKNINGNVFREGKNVIAAELRNSALAAKFDVELIGLNNSRDTAMMVMTDGVANEDAGCPQTGTPSEEAIEAACEAREDYGITVYAVGYSASSDVATLQSIAQCGDGLFAQSSNVTALQEFYEDVALLIVSATRHSQTIEVEGTLFDSTLYDDSYIWFNFTPGVAPPQFGEIALRFEESNFTNCSFNVNIPSQIRISEARLTSYSSEHWADGLIMNNKDVYNLSSFHTDYTPLGDPFIIDIPPSMLNGGSNSFYVRTGDDPYNTTGCSLNNTFLYTGLVDSSISYSSVLPKADGCRWTIETEGSGNITARVPSDYSGGKNCYYTNSLFSYDSEDSIDLAVFNLLSNLDFDSDGRIDINIEEQDLEIESLSVTQVPFLWGPAVVEVRAWQ